jgi:hypothetical protein
MRWCSWTADIANLLTTLDTFTGAQTHARRIKMTVKGQYLPSVLKRMANDYYSLIPSPTKRYGVCYTAMADAVNRRAETATTPTSPPILAGMVLFISTSVDAEVGPAARHAVTIRWTERKVQNIYNSTVRFFLSRASRDSRQARIA